MLPIEFTERMKELLGDEYDAFLATYDRENYRALRLNPLKATIEQLELCRNNLEQVPWESNGFYFAEDVRPGIHPYHGAGVYYIQEPSAMLPVNWLEPEPGELVLDLCAAPGGKTTQIGGLMKGEGILVCNEIEGKRAKILSENIERMGISNAIVLNEDPNHLKDIFVEYFDRILVDAPCSGEGMFKKNDNAIGEWSLENVLMCADRQKMILDAAASMLKPGGCLVYSTCTFSPEEDEKCIEHFIQSHSDYELIKMQRLFPHKVKGEGHFVAKLIKKSGDASGGYVSTGVYRGVELCEGNDKQSGKEKKNKKASAKKNDNIALLYEFLNENVINWQSLLGGRLLEFGDNFYLYPEGAFNLTGIKVIRPGLQLGSVKKGKFEPSHSLALHLGKDDFAKTVNISTDTITDKGEGIKNIELFGNYANSVPFKTAYDYINGQTFNYEGENGWYLICLDGYSLGFGRLASGIMKNYYPKGLRK